MRRLWMVASMIIVIFILVWFCSAQAGQMEELAIKIQTMTMEKDVNLQTLRDKQAELFKIKEWKDFADQNNLVVRMREDFKKETDPKKKGTLAVNIMAEEKKLDDLAKLVNEGPNTEKLKTMRKEIDEMAERINEKAVKEQELRDKFKKLIDKELKK
jgi:hypothetical protein